MSAAANLYEQPFSEEELRLVENVGAGLRIRPVAEDAFQAAVHSPFRLS